MNRSDVVAAVMMGVPLGSSTQVWAGEPLLPGEQFAVAAFPQSASKQHAEGGGLGRAHSPNCVLSSSVDRGSGPMFIDGDHHKHPRCTDAPVSCQQVLALHLDGHAERSSADMDDGPR